MPEENVAQEMGGFCTVENAGRRAQVLQERALEMFRTTSLATVTATVGWALPFEMSFSLTWERHTTPKSEKEQQ